MKKSNIKIIIGAGIAMVSMTAAITAAYKYTENLLSMAMDRSFKPTKKSADRKKQKNGAFVPATDVKKRGRNQSFSQGRSKITKNGNQNAKKNRR